MQVAATVLSLLGINPSGLDAVKAESTKPLPGYTYTGSPHPSSNPKFSVGEAE